MRNTRKVLARPTNLQISRPGTHRRSQGGAEGHGLTKILTYLTYLIPWFFEKRCPKQNAVASLISNISPPKKFLGLLTCFQQGSVVEVTVSTTPLSVDIRNFWYTGLFLEDFIKCLLSLVCLALEKHSWTTSV